MPGQIKLQAPLLMLPFMKSFKFQFASIVPLEPKYFGSQKLLFSSFLPSLSLKDFVHSESFNNICMVL